MPPLGVVFSFYMIILSTSMSDEEVIKKAKKVLDAIGATHKNIKVSVIRETNDLLLEMDESFKDEYYVIFTYYSTGQLISTISVSVNRQTNKLLRVVTPSEMFDVPEELQ